MSAIFEFLESTFSPVVLLFTVANLGAMGLQTRLPEVAAALRNRRAIALIFVWGWGLGPALGLLITKVLPLEEPYVIVVLLASLAPCAPFLQQMVAKAGGDVGFAGAFIPLVVIGTVVLMPFFAPWLIEGLSIDAWALARPLLITILLPLVVGAVLRNLASSAAERVFPTVKKIALLSTLATILWCLLLYGRGMLDTAGSLSLLAMTLFMVGMGAITYRVGFAMTPGQRSVMSLGMGTRNIAAVLVAALAIPDADPRIVVMVVMWTLWSVVLASVAARIFARRADAVVAGGSA